MLQCTQVSNDGPGDDNGGGRRDGSRRSSSRVAVTQQARRPTRVRPDGWGRNNGGGDDGGDGGVVLRGDDDGGGEGDGDVDGDSVSRPVSSRTMGISICTNENPHWRQGPCVWTWLVPGRASFGAEISVAPLQTVLVRPQRSCARPKRWEKHDDQRYARGFGCVH